MIRLKRQNQKSTRATLWRMVIILLLTGAGMHSSAMAQTISRDVYTPTYTSSNPTQCYGSGSPTIANCYADANALTVARMYGSATQSGKLADHNASGSVIWTGNNGYTADSRYFETGGDSLLAQGTQSQTVQVPNVSAANGFTVEGTFYINSSSIRGKGKKNVLFSFTALNGLPVGVLSTDGQHFIWTRCLSASPCDDGNGHSYTTFTQEFWDPIMYNPANSSIASNACMPTAGSYMPTAWYSVYLTVGSDQKMVLDMFHYDSSQPMKYCWFESEIDGGWPSVYGPETATKAAFTAQTSYQAAPDGGLAVNLFAPALGTTSFTNFGYPTYTVQPRLARFFLYGAPLSQAQVLSAYSNLESGALEGAGNPIQLSDANLPVQPGNTPTASQVFPCNTGAFLNTPAQVSQGYVVTPCGNKSIAFQNIAPTLATNVSATVDESGMVTVKWTAPPSVRYTLDSAYAINVFPNTGNNPVQYAWDLPAESNESTSTQYQARTPGPITENTTYTVFLTANNTAGTSTTSVLISPPSAPNSLALSAATANSLTFTWSPPSYTGGTISYSLTLTDDANGNNIDEILSGDTSEFEFQGLESIHHYGLTLCAQSWVGPGECTSGTFSTN